MEEQIKQVVAAAIKDGITSQWWVSFLILIFSVIGGALGGYISAYTKKKGENYATKEDFDALFEQTKKTAQGTEEIKATISKQSTVAQSEFDFRKRQLAEFYGPIYSHLMVNKKIYPLWMNGNLKEINLEIIEMFRKQNEAIAEIITNKFHLIDGGEIPEVFTDFITSTTIWNFYTARPGKPYLDDDVKSLEEVKWSKAFEKHIEEKTEELKRRLDELHKKYTIV